MGFGGYQDPMERAAAAEAARRAGEARALEDARTEALAAAITEGFGLVASAILAAAGLRPMLDGLGDLSDPKQEPPWMLCEGAGCVVNGVQNRSLFNFFGRWLCVACARKASAPQSASEVDCEIVEDDDVRDLLHDTGPE
jgi:hypothetical protein